MKPEGWKANVDEIYTFFDKILHSESVIKARPSDTDSDEEGNGGNGWGNNNQQEEQEEEEEQPEQDD